MTHINLQYLNEITGGDPEIIKEFVEDVVKLKDEVWNEIKHAYANHDIKAIKESAHKLKSSVKIFGSDIFQNKLEQIEQEDEISNIGALVKDLSEIIPVWQEELEVISKK